MKRNNSILLIELINEYKEIREYLKKNIYKTSPINIFKQKDIFIYLGHIQN